MSLDILHGGHIRFSALLSALETIAFVQGRVVTLNLAGQVRVSSVGVVEVIGLATDAVESTTMHSPTADQLIGPPSGQHIGMVLDEAVVVDDQISGNGTLVFAMTDMVYVDAQGRLTNVNTRNRVIGKPLVPHVAGQALTFLFSVQY